MSPNTIYSECKSLGMLCIYVFTFPNMAVGVYRPTLTPIPRLPHRSWQYYALRSSPRPLAWPRLYTISPNLILSKQPNNFSTSLLWEAEKTLSKQCFITLRLLVSQVGSPRTKEPQRSWLFHYWSWTNVWTRHRAYIYSTCKRQYVFSIW